MDDEQRGWAASIQRRLNPGFTHSLTLRQDGAVVAWGDDASTLGLKRKPVPDSHNSRPRLCISGLSADVVDAEDPGAEGDSERHNSCNHPGQPPSGPRGGGHHRSGDQAADGERQDRFSCLVGLLVRKEAFTAEVTAPCDEGEDSGDEPNQEDDGHSPDQVELPPRRIAPSLVLVGHRPTVALPDPAKHPALALPEIAVVPYALSFPLASTSNKISGAEVVPAEIPTEGLSSSYIGSSYTLSPGTRVSGVPLSALVFNARASCVHGGKLAGCTVTCSCTH